MPEEFPQEVEAQANKIPDEVSEDIIKNRRDLRDRVIVTIDGEDAKDLDDAVSLEVLRMVTIYWDYILQMLANMYLRTVTWIKRL